MSSENDIEQRGGPVLKPSLSPIAGIRVLACFAVVFCNVMYDFLA